MGLGGVCVLFLTAKKMGLTFTCLPSSKRMKEKGSMVAQAHKSKNKPER